MHPYIVTTLGVVKYCPIDGSRLTVREVDEGYFSGWQKAADREHPIDEVNALLERESHFNTVTGERVK